jgi:hypothetical protein
MKQAITLPLKAFIPPPPQKGDIKACRLYAEHKARQSEHYQKTLTDIWIRFMMWSFLDDDQEVQQ